MMFKQQKWTPINPILSVITSQPSLLDLKSADIAEQMTLLDAELFQKIEIPEVLIWAQEQCEERSPNLTKFTEHFNKMSYWYVRCVHLIIVFDDIVIIVIFPTQGSFANFKAGGQQGSRETRDKIH